MVATTRRATPGTQRGVSLVEALVTIVIIALGLLGLVGLQSRLQLSEIEAYQRSQAMILLEDMANRISMNRAAIANYLTGNQPLGTGFTCNLASIPDTSANRIARDRCEWSMALEGAAATINSGANRVGTMVGGRGCVENLGGGEYLITVAWQGQVPLSTPPDGVACGASLYDGDTGSPCREDRCRRTLTTIVRVPNFL